MIINNTYLNESSLISWSHKFINFYGVCVSLKIMLIIIMLKKNSAEI